jgi:hypothetical protein
MIFAILASIALNILATMSLVTSAKKSDVGGATVAWLMCTPLVVSTIVLFSPISGLVGTLYFFASPIYLLACLTILAALALLRKSGGFSRLAPWIIALGLVSHAISIGSLSSVLRSTASSRVEVETGF